MKNYKIPNAEIVKFDIENIITASGAITDAGNLTGENLKMYEAYQASSPVKNTNVAIFTW